MKKQLPILFDESSAEFIITCFTDIEKECISCKKEISGKTLGAVIKAGFLCRNLGCHLSHLYIKDEK